MSLCSAQWHGATVMALESFSPSLLSCWEFNPNEESKATDRIADELLIPDIFHASSKGNRHQKILGCFLLPTTCSTVKLKVAVAPNKSGNCSNAALCESCSNYCLCLCSNLWFGILLLYLWLFVRSCCDEQRLHQKQKKQKENSDLSQILDDLRLKNNTILKNSIKQVSKISEKFLLDEVILKTIFLCRMSHLALLQLPSDLDPGDSNIWY